MATCYNITYNESTSAFEKHGGTVLVSGIHSCGFYVDITEPNNTLLNTSADQSVISSNNTLTSTITSANQQTSGTPDVNIEATNMTLKLKIKLINPIVTVEYKPLTKVKVDGVVTR